MGIGMSAFGVDSPALRSVALPRRLRSYQICLEVSSSASIHDICDLARRPAIDKGVSLRYSLSVS
jgi:hypothetical protein